QEIPHDVWDFDAAYECILLDLPVKGVTRKLLLNINKGGYAFVLDRTNGAFVAAWPTVKLLNWIKGVDEKGNLVGRHEPKLGESVLICPSIGGGRSWNHAAFSPKTNLIFTTGIEWCQEVIARQEAPQEGKEFFGATFTLKKPPEGEVGSHLDAWEPVT